MIKVDAIGCNAAAMQCFLQLSTSRVKLKNRFFIINSPTVHHHSCLRHARCTRSVDVEKSACVHKDRERSRYFSAASAYFLWPSRITRMTRSKGQQVGFEPWRPWSWIFTEFIIYFFTFMLCLQQFHVCGMHPDSLSHSFPCLCLSFHVLSVFMTVCTSKDLTNVILGMSREGRNHTSKSIRGKWIHRYIYIYCFGSEVWM